VHYQGTHPASESKSINTRTTRKDKLAVEATTTFRLQVLRRTKSMWKDGHLVDMILDASANHNFANASVE
jgi:hypothetical protein